MVAETIERAPARNGADEVTVLALIEERTRLLPREWCRQEPHAVFVDFDLARDIPIEDGGLTRQALFRPQRHVVAGQDSRRLDQRAQRRENLLAKRLEAGAHELHYQPLIIAIGDQRRQAI